MLSLEQIPDPEIYVYTGEFIKFNAEFVSLLIKFVRNSNCYTVSIHSWGSTSGFVIFAPITHCTCISQFEHTHKQIRP